MIEKTQQTSKAMPDTCKLLCSQKSGRSTGELESMHQYHGVDRKLLCVFRYANQKQDCDSVKDLMSEKETCQINNQAPA